MAAEMLKADTEAASVDIYPNVAFVLLFLCNSMVLIVNCLFIVPLFKEINCHLQFFLLSVACHIFVNANSLGIKSFL